jgi:NTE family protein
MVTSQPRIGVALCGAELGGSVQIGVLHGLEQMGVRPHCVAGTSAGAIVASMYAHGYTFAEFRRAVAKFPGLFLLDYGFPLASSLRNVFLHRWRGRDIPVPNGLVRGKRLQRYLTRLHRNRLPKLPYYLVATDLHTTDPVVFTNDAAAVRRGLAHPSTNLSVEIAASCAIPGLFTPIRHRRWMLVDGGVRDNVPVSILRKAGCTKIVAVDAHRIPEHWYPVTTVDVIRRSLQALMDEAMDASDLQGDDVFVVKTDWKSVSWWTCCKALRENIDVGTRTVLGLRDDIQCFLQS